jgi:hypothetical protein
VAAGVLSAAGPAAAVATPNDARAGSQGTVTGLSATPSQVVVHGHGSEAGLTVTVNQTQNLANQAISVSWSEQTPAPTFSDPSSGAFDSTFNGNYLQMFECWGDPQTADPPDAGAGPLPSQCEVGGESSSAASSYPIKDLGFEYSRVLSQPSWDGYSQLAAQPSLYVDTGTVKSPGTDFVVEPFDAVDGTVVGQQADYNYLLNPFAPKPFWLNPYFSFANTNEVDFARTYANGTGQQLFQVDTGLEAPGLGCGQSIQPVTGGGTKTPQCWLVVVPRTTPSVENPANVTNVSSVVTSPLTPEAWANRIAIPLSFNPVGSNCSISTSAQQLIGGELASPAVASWEPSLCNLPGSTPFSYIQNSDDQARQNLIDPSYGSVGMSVFSDPIPPGQTSKPVVYAPLTLSGVVVAFNIERVPITDPDGNLQPDELKLSGDRVAHLYLTPLLVARLLSESYQDQLEGVTLHPSAKYQWVQHNPVSLFDDPEFLRYNPEFAELSSVYQGDAGALIVEEGSSDATSLLWKWVLSDPEAKAWLGGLPGQGADQTMNVNPYYSTNPAINPSGVPFGSPIPESFPKSDPYTENTGQTVYPQSGLTSLAARPLDVLDWSPFLLTMRSTASATAAANDGAKTTFDPTQTPDTAWTANGPQITGHYFVMSVTDSASAARYGLQTASLSRAGDDTANRTFVAPDATGLLDGEQAMVPSAVPGVLQPDPTTAAAGAYPLTTLTYAATVPSALNASSRSNYAAFLRYAAGAGQSVGVQPGQLPAGYVPLPSALRAETLAAADTILRQPSSAHPTATTSPEATRSAGNGTVTGAAGGTTLSAYGGTGGAGGTAVTSGAGRAARSPTRGIPAALSAVHTRGIPIGALRWVVPIVLLLGLGALLAALATKLTGRRAATAGTAVDAGGAGAGDPGGSES